MNITKLLSCHIISSQAASQLFDSCCLPFHYFAAVIAVVSGGALVHGFALVQMQINANFFGFRVIFQINMKSRICSAPQRTSERVFFSAVNKTNKTVAGWPENIFNSLVGIINNSKPHSQAKLNLNFVKKISADSHQKNRDTGQNSKIVH